MIATRRLDIEGEVILPPGGLEAMISDDKYPFHYVLTSLIAKSLVPLYDPTFPSHQKSSDGIVRTSMGESLKLDSSLCILQFGEKEKGLFS